jgi:Na+/proline symporter
MSLSSVPLGNALPLAAANPAVSGYDVFIIVAYLVFLASIGWISKKFAKGSTDYFAGGMKMTWWLLGAGSFVSNFSSWTFTGAAGIAYTYGLLIFSVYVIDVLGFIVSYVWFAPAVRQLRLITAMDAMRLRFGPTSEQFFTWLNFINSLAVAAVWLVGLSIILSSAFGFPQQMVIFGTGAVVVLIALMGGTWSVAASDFVQLIVLMSITVVVGVLTLIKIGGVSAFLAQIPETHWQVLHPAGSISYDWVYLVTAVLSVVYAKNNLGLAGKYIAAKDGTHARRSTLVPMIGYIVMPIFWFIPPLAAFTLVPNLASQNLMSNPAEASYVAVCIAVLPQGLLGLMIVAMFSATISSMDVALNKNAGIFVKNFYQPVLRPRATDGELLTAGRVSTFAFGLLVTAAATALVLGGKVSLFDTFLYFNAYIGYPLSVPMFMAMVMRRVPSWSGWATVLFGVAVTVVLYDFLPTAAGRAAIMPWVGEGLYGYMVTNKFVLTNAVAVPLIMLFFWSTKFFYRPGMDAGYELTANEFFRRIKTPVNFETEVGGDNTPAQARLVGRLALAFGGFMALLVFIPNTLFDRASIFACALFPLGVGYGLLRYASRHAARTEAAGGESSR